MQSNYYSFQEFEKLIKGHRPKDVVQRYIHDLFPFCFHEKPELYWTFREIICKEIGIHPQGFSIAGSGKLGFSLSPNKLGKLFDDGSDIDVVLVSKDLFDEIWDRLIVFRSSSTYKLHSTDTKKTFERMQFMLFFGHIRLDILSRNFDFAKEWWEFFNRLSTDLTFGPRQVNAMIFKSWELVDNFYERSIQDIQLQQQD